MKAALLLKLADLLDALPPERFDYAHWIGSDWQGDPDIHCGAAACALGWACTMPELRSVIELRMPGREPRAAHVALVGSPEQPGRMPPPWRLSFESAVVAFDITYSQAETLFAPGDGEGHEGEAPPEDAGPQAVATHIRECVEAWS